MSRLPRSCEITSSVAVSSVPFSMMSVRFARPSSACWFSMISNWIIGGLNTVWLVMLVFEFSSQTIEVGVSSV